MIPSNLDNSELKHLAPEAISRNPDNPRMFFRQEELDTLRESIFRYGIQVPVTVFRDGANYVLIDGERRWTCAVDLNMKSIPALVLPKPTALDNLLLMFNIHSLREQWDFFTIANKLPDVISRFEEQNSYPPNEVELSEITGLTRGQIRRCRLLLDLPEKYKNLLEKELEKPKLRQRLSEDFFIEMERSLKTVQKRAPESIDDVNRVRDTLIQKFEKGSIKAMTDFRMLAKIATSIEGLGVQKDRANKALREIFDDTNEKGIAEVYSGDFEFKYDEKKVAQNAQTVIQYLEEFVEEREVESDQFDRFLRSTLIKLRDAIDRALGE